jgi:RTX calcium-binding nonapeptide repeat (4 copies)
MFCKCEIKIFGTEGADNLIGTINKDKIQGFDGNDTILIYSV